MHCTSHLLPLNIISSLTRIKIPIVKEVIFMVDTIDVEYIFPSKRNYNICFELLNSMAKHKSHQIHKEKWQHRHSYVTNAFKSLGWLKIRFYCYERGYALRLSWKPYFTVYLDHNPISVSSPEDYTDAENNDAAIAFYKSNGYSYESYQNPEDPACVKYKVLIFSKALTYEELVPWNNRSIHLTEQIAKQKIGSS